jgi:hypothetical protein
MPSLAMFILTIKERNFSWAGRGPLVMTYETRDEAKQGLIDYVSEQWGSEMDMDDRPEDPGDMVAAYFDHVLEAYEILEVNP